MCDSFLTEAILYTAMHNIVTAKLPHGNWGFLNANCIKATGYHEFKLKCLVENVVVVVNQWYLWVCVLHFIGTESFQKRKPGSCVLDVVCQTRGSHRGEKNYICYSLNQTPLQQNTGQSYTFCIVDILS